MFENRNSSFNRKKVLLLKLNFQRGKIITLRQILQKSVSKVLFNPLINEGSIDTVLGSEEALGRRGLALHVSFGYFATYMNYLIGKVAIYINFIYI